MPLKTLFSLSICLCCVQLSFGQLVVDEGFTPEHLINNVLLGDGIEAELVTMNGVEGSTQSMQVGYFDATQSNIGISTGIILATGGVSVAESPNDIPTAYVTIPEDEELTSCFELEQIMAPAELNDAAVLEFDFTAKGDTLRFKYVFASEEYNEHVCSPYNDAFGFFISGPGIIGDPGNPNNAKNVALVPGTNVPVAINTVNRGTAGEFGASSVCNAAYSGWEQNQIYFVDNENNGTIEATQFDGFTVPFIVEIPVICGGSYHIKLAIGDAVDGKNDSAVFLEAGSFESLVPLEADLSVLNADENNSAIEGCSELKIRLERSDSSDVKTVYVRTTGLENPSSVIPDLPDSITFYPMQGVINLSIPVVDNAVYEELRNVGVELIQLDLCSLDSAVTVLPFQITDKPELITDYVNEIGLHCNESAQIDIEVNGGYPPYSIDWSDGLSGFSFIYETDSNDVLTGVIRDQCGIHQETIQINVFQETYDSLSVSVPSLVQFNCAENVVVNPMVTGGKGEYEFQWIIDGEVISTEPEFDAFVNENSQLILIVQDICMPAVQEAIQLESVVNPIFVSLGSDTTATCAEPLFIVPEVSGGVGTVQFIWTLNQFQVSSASTFQFQPENTSIVKLEVTDDCLQVASDSIMVFMADAPLQVSMVTDTTICSGDFLFVEPTIIGGYGDFVYQWNDVVKDEKDLSVFPEVSKTYSFEIEDGCGRTAGANLSVEVSDVEAEFEFDYSFPVRLINRSTPNSNYQWKLVDGTLSDQFEPIVEIESIRDGYTHLEVVNSFGCIAATRMLFEPEMSLFIPNAFTPDNDGLNDVFKAYGEYIANFEMQIFDRWGVLIFETNDIEKGWNGEGANRDLYTAQDFVFSYRYTVESWLGEIEQGIGKVHMLR